MVGLDNPLHIALILVVVLLVFGAKRLPEMGKGLGEGMRGFKHAISGETPETPEPISLATAEEPVVAQPVPTQPVPAQPVAPHAVAPLAVAPQEATLAAQQREPAAPVAS